MSINDLKKIIIMTINAENDFESRRKILLDHKKELKKQQNTLDKAFKKIEVKLKYFADLENKYKSLEDDNLH